MEVKKLYEMVDEDQKEGSLGEKAYWKDLWNATSRRRAWIMHL